jgi:hypothetical protein
MVMIPRRLMDLRRARRPQSGSAPPRGSLTTAVRDAARFDRAAISARGGLLAAIPVAAMLAIGTVAWSAAAGSTMAAGAMLVGIASRISGGRPPFAVLGVGGFAMALSTFAGCVTGSVGWLHPGVLALRSGAGRTAVERRGDAAHDDEVEALLSDLDEVVDAADSLATVVGLETDSTAGGPEDPVLSAGQRRWASLDGGGDGGRITVPAAQGSQLERWMAAAAERQ